MKITMHLIIDRPISITLIRINCTKSRLAEPYSTMVPMLTLNQERMDQLLSLHVSKWGQAIKIITKNIFNT